MSKQRKATALKRSFGQRVRSLRNAAGMSQMDLGERSGLDHTYVGGVERGERNLSIEAIGKLAQGLDMEISELFRFSSRQLTVPNPHLAELVALLEQRDDSDVHHALEFVTKLLHWRDEA